MKKKLFIISIILTFLTVLAFAEENTEWDFVFVEGGTFDMGREQGDKAESPVHTVTVNSFYMCIHEVTQLEYYNIMGENPSYFKGKYLPVEWITWYS